VATTNQAAENERTGRGYAGAVLISALGHLALGVLLLVVLPGYVHAPQKELPSYTVKIVDNIPAGDLGSHLPRLSRRPPSPPQEVKPRPRVEEPPKVVVKPPPAPPPPDNDKNAIALNSVRTTAPTPAPTPKPVMPPAPQPSPKPAPTRAVSHHPTPKPTVRAHESPRPKSSPAVVIAKAESSSSVKQRLNKIREQLLAEHLTQVKKAPPDADAADSDDSDDSDDQASGGGPVVAKVATEGKGLGIGSGQGSAGIQQDLDFLLYYRSVQERIKQAWSFSGGNNELTTRVVFAIGADGKLTDVKITQSSRNASFDDSVIRAIRRAAPFTVPPDKYRDQFVKGIEAVFKLGELNS